MMSDEKKPKNFYPISFILPDKDNKITENDINRRYLRITKAFKQYFPSQDSDIDITINGKNFLCEFKYKGKDASKDEKERSHLLKLKEAMNELDLKPGDSIQFVQIGNYKFKLSKIN